MHYGGYSHDYLGQLKLYNRIVRSSFSLPDDQRVTLLFVLDRTIGWQKVWESISIKEFENGVFRRKAGKRRLIVRGTGLSPERINAATKALHEIGAIEVINIPPKVNYRLEEDWCHPELRRNGSREVWGLNESDYLYRSDDEED